MYLDYKEFKGISKNIKQVFEAWFENLKQFKDMIRGQIGRKSDRTGVSNLISLEKNPIKDRLDQIIVFRHQHYKLK
jgi:hypothetical protein